MKKPIVIISSKIGEIIDMLKNDNKVTELPNDIVQQINEELNLEMSEFRQELSRKEAVSNRETSKIILIS